METLIRMTTVPISLEKLLENQMGYMKSYYHIIAISAEEHALNKVGLDQGVPTFALNLTRKITPWTDLKAVFNLYRYLKEVKPKIIHTHTPKAGVVGMMAAKLAGVPIRMHTVAGLPLMETAGLKRRVLNFVEALTYACATHVYPNSNGLKGIILEHKFCAASKLKVLGSGSSNGIDTSKFSKNAVPPHVVRTLADQLHVSTDDFLFVFVGRLVVDKGIVELVTAFKELSKIHKHIKLILVGPFESDLDPLPDSILEEINTNKQIIHTGYQSDVRPYFAISSILVFPSYREGFPNVVLQAGAMELPSIVSNINGCNEIIHEGINGFIVPSKSVKPLQDAMEYVLKNRALMNEMGRESRNYVEKSFQQSVIWEALLQEYKLLERYVSNN
ncbi:MAG: glycosyltransferase family 4 protein [Flavobacterium sp.]|nr:glycosyltransferase family 4 protein [Candidatus Neoflavobacterium equi]